MSLLVLFAGGGGGAVSGTLSATLSGITFAGTGTETISGTAAATLGSITFAGVGTETETGTLAFTTAGVQFAGAGAETIDGSLSATTDSILFSGQGAVPVEISGTIAFTTGGITFSGSGESVSGPESGGGTTSKTPRRQLTIIRRKDEAVFADDDLGKARLAAELEAARLLAGQDAERFRRESLTPITSIKVVPQEIITSDNDADLQFAKTSVQALIAGAGEQVIDDDLEAIAMVLALIE